MLMAFLAACQRQQNAAQSAPESASISEKPLIAVSILPHAWFVERIAAGAEGEPLVDTLVLAGPGQNPHSFELSPGQLEALSRSSVWVLSGTEFEISLRPKIENLFKTLVIRDGTKGVKFRHLEEAHSEHLSGEIGIDRHTWLGQEPAEILAAHIRDELSRMDADNAAQYQKNYENLVAEIKAEFAALREKLFPLSGKPVFVYHPAFGYFLDEFNIRQEAVETGGKEPGPRALNALIEQAQLEKPAAVFVQAQFPVSTVETIARAAGAEVIALDPLERDWLANIREMGAALERSAQRHE